MCRYFCWYSFYLMDCNCVSFKPLLYLRISNRNSANKVYTFNSVLDISFFLWHCSAMRDEKEMRRAIFFFIFQALLKASIYNNWTFFNNLLPRKLIPPQFVSTSFWGALARTGALTNFMCATMRDFHVQKLFDNKIFHRLRSKIQLNCDLCCAFLKTFEFFDKLFSYCELYIPLQTIVWCIPIVFLNPGLNGIFNFKLI